MFDAQDVVNEQSVAGVQVQRDSDSAEIFAVRNLNLLCNIAIVEKRNVSEGDIALFNVFFGDLLASECACNAERVAFGEYTDRIGIFPNLVIG